MPSGGGSILRGIAIGIAWTVAGLIGCALLVAAGGIGFIPLFGIGLAQALWMAPVAFSYKRRGEMETVKGMLIVAGLVFMLNASCWGLLAAGKFRIAG
jgi:hypothetical protein